MENDKSNILDVLAMMGTIILFTGVSAAALSGGDLFGTLLLGGLALLITWLLMRDLRKGVRPPNRWEWFRTWMTVRPVVIGAIGVAVLFAILAYGREEMPNPPDEVGIMLTGGVLVWALLILYTAFRAPRRRYEDDAAYKKRIDWKDLEEPL